MIMERQPCRQGTGMINPYKTRSWLFVPAVKECFFDKVLGLRGREKPDVLIFDLEDSVHAGSKAEARRILHKRLHEGGAYRKEVSGRYVIAVRINSQETAWFREDLELVNRIRPDFLMLSKVESPDHVRAARESGGVPQLFVVIETIKGFENREEIMKEMEWYDIFTLGYEDLSAELMIERPASLDSVNPITDMLLKTVISARKNNVTMIDAVSRGYGTPDNLKRTEDECAFTAGLGLSGKIAIHPSQVQVINSVFDKGPLLERAERVLGMFGELKDGSSVISGDSKEMMDTPSRRLHSKILELWNR
jgi:citrate lyase subunit beta/citryl-CoA lyase